MSYDPVKLINLVEKRSIKENPPQFAVGDTVDVQVKITEGEGKDAKERIQVFSGVVIARKGTGINASFTVRRVVNNEGVERIFMLHSPKIADVHVKRSGFTRRAKLYYLRDRVGKATKLREVKTEEKAAAEKVLEKAAVEKTPVTPAVPAQA
jgi:large subunit ribosomal protein L19